MHLHTQKFKKMFLVIVNIAALKLHEKSNEKRENHTIIELYFTYIFCKLLRWLSWIEFS